jgi:hypothetical protein
MRVLNVIVLASAMSFGVSPLFGQTTAGVANIQTVRIPLTGVQALRMPTPVASPIAPMVSHPIQPIVQSPYIQYSTPQPLQVTIPATVIIIPERRVVSKDAKPPLAPFHQPPDRTPDTTIIVPNSTVVLPHATGAPVIHTFPFAPQPAVVLPSTPVFVSPVESVPPLGSQSVVIATDSPRRNIRPVPLGTSRADVIFQLGRPIGTAGTPSTETLFFEGGMMVVLQDGRVVQIR